MTDAADWRAERTRSGGTELIALHAGDAPLSFRDLFSLLQDEPPFADWYSALLADAPFAAFFWEHPALTTRTAAADAEFALVDAPVLARLRPDPGPFRDRFRGDDVVTFRNLGGDAFLIAPSPGDAGTDYAHLAAFLRTAPDAARRALWRCVGRSVLRSLTAVPLWVSTSGAGVAWLHVRLDARPKYYQHRPYRQAGA